MKRQIAMLFATTLLLGGTATAKELTVAAMTGNVPFEFEDINGQWVGFEVDLIQSIGKRLGKEVKIIPMPFNSLFSAVQSGRADVAIGSVGVTPKRLESVSFTQPYYDANQCLTTNSNGEVKSLDDLTGKPVAVLTGTTGEIWASQHNSQYQFSEIRRYDGVSDPMLDIATGRINAFIHDCPIDAYYIKNKPQYSIVATIPTNEVLSLMLSKDNPLVDELDKAVTEIKKSGELAQLYKKWFDVEPDTESSTVKILPIPRK